MPWLKWIVVALALLQGGWLLFDGGRAFLVGDYVTASSGSHAGQLGPWSKLVAAVGLDPRGTFMKSAHVLLGAVWLIAVVVFVLRPNTGWWGLLMCGIASLWYLPIGTVLSLVQIVLLIVMQRT